MMHGPTLRSVGPGRAQAKTAFLATAGWDTPERIPLAGDASPRSYERLRNPEAGTAILMDADPSRGQDVRPFVQVAQLLRGFGLSAPAVLAQDDTQGFLLLEDLGDDLFARLARNDPDSEERLYKAATDLLTDLHRHAPPKTLPRYDPTKMAPLSALAAIWYGTGLSGRDPDHGLGQELEQTMLTHLQTFAAETSVIVFRDYHAENLIWLPGRAGHARVGLLDFQDAAAGHPAYDLVSLLCDARRDVPQALREAMIDRYLAETGRDAHAFLASCAVLGAQRNLRILGGFARLSLRDGKTGYVDLIPRVWSLLQRDLDHPACARLAELVTRQIPPPTPHGLSLLRTRAGSCPMP